MNISNSVHAYSQQSYSLDIVTSSGDHISLDMNKQQEASFSSNKNKSEISKSFSYSSIEEYSFKYGGNGIDENDREEIELALEKAGPMMKEFMNGFSDDMKNLIALNPETSKIANIFAPLKENSNSNNINFTKSSLVAKMDEIIKSFGKRDLIEEGAKFLQKLFENMDKDFILYG